MSDRTTRIVILGTGTAMPEAGDDTASFLINDRYLVDTGLNVMGNLRARGVDPLAVEYLIFTHLHHDHYLSLPALIHYRAMKRAPLENLKIIGPVEDVARVVGLAMAFLEMERFFPGCGTPTLIPLAPGNGYRDPAFGVTTCATVHPVPGLCYRFTDHATGVTFAFTGDTAPHPPLIAHVRGSRLLITESTFGPVAADPATNGGLHSGAPDAARLAAAAAVGGLVLVHGERAHATESVRVAREIFPQTWDWPTVGQVIELA